MFIKDHNSFWQAHKLIHSNRKHFAYFYNGAEDKSHLPTNPIFQNLHNIIIYSSDPRDELISLGSFETKAKTERNNTAFLMARRRFASY